jgi:hypothetical protein
LAAGIVSGRARPRQAGWFDGAEGAVGSLDEGAAQTGNLGSLLGVVGKGAVSAVDRLLAAGVGEEGCGEGEPGLEGRLLKGTRTRLRYRPPCRFLAWAVSGG